MDGNVTSRALAKTQNGTGPFHLWIRIERVGKCEQVHLGKSQLNEFIHVYIYFDDKKFGDDRSAPTL